jgi:membrane protein implicated in regulation of membrane protease activity
MSWANFYLFCFLFGLVMSVVTLLVGVLHVHLPGLDHLHLDHHLDFGGDAAADVHAESAHHGAGVHASPLNFPSMMAFLTWFGAAGYLLTTMHYGAFFVVTLSSGIGVIGAGIVFLFLAKVLLRTDSTLYDADYRMDGLLGHVSMAIRAGGTGEIIFSQEGVRRTCGARSEDGSAISRGTEIVITRYEKGIAYVRRWEDLAREAGVTSSSGSGSPQ